MSHGMETPGKTQDARNFPAGLGTPQCLLVELKEVTEDGDVWRSLINPHDPKPVKW